MILTETRWSTNKLRARHTTGHLYSIFSLLAPVRGDEPFSIVLHRVQWNEKVWAFHSIKFSYEHYLLQLSINSLSTRINVFAVARNGTFLRKDASCCSVGGICEVMKNCRIGRNVSEQWNVFSKTTVFVFNHLGLFCTKFAFRVFLS